MAFTPTTTQPLTACAQITVRFAGLLLLRPDAENNCEVGIHRFNNDHTFQIMLIVRKPQRPPTLIRLVTGALTRPFAIDVTPNPGTGVQAFAPTPAPFLRNAPNNNELDYRWALDLRTIHANADFNDGARPVATLNAGTLYTPTVTRLVLNPQLVQGLIRTPLHRFSADLAAALPTGSTVELSWDELGEPRRVTLPRPLDPQGTTYTISLINDPPVFGAAAQDELDLYYRVLVDSGTPIPINKRCRIAYSPGPTTDEIPCMPVVLNS
jgi:hypothetical protein